MTSPAQQREGGANQEQESGDIYFPKLANDNSNNESHYWEENLYGFILTR